jgi:hypothetical protein
VFLALPRAAFALPPEFISANGIQPGMKGYALAQFYADKIERFDVEILSVYGKRHPEKGYYRRMLGIVSGGSLEVSRGISTGFSGAPVYIDGRLAGAIESSPAWTAKNYVTIVGIEEMLELYNMPSFASGDAEAASVTAVNSYSSSPEAAGIGDERGAGSDDGTVERFELDTPIRLGESIIEGIAVADSPAQLGGLRGDGATLAMVRCGGIAIACDPATGAFVIDPLNARVDDADGAEPAFGPGEAGHRSLQTTQPFSDSFYPIGAPLDYAPFAPGAMISIPLVRGDLDLYLNGTLTYIAPDGRFIAFAHAIDGAYGSIRLPVARSHVYTTQTQLQENFSIIKTGDIVGTLLEDRNMGGAGTLATYEDFCSVHVKLTSAQSRFVAESNTEVVKSERHFRDYFPFTLGYMLGRTADEWGKGALHYALKMKLPGLDSPVLIEDTCFDQWDWRGSLVGMAAAIDARLVDSELGYFVPEWIDVECTFISDERTERIADVTFGRIVDGEFHEFETQPSAGNGAPAKLAQGDSFAADFKVVAPDGVTHSVYIETALADDFPVGGARIQLRGGRSRMPVDRGITPQMMQAYWNEMNSLVAFRKPAAPKSRDELYAELAEVENGGTIILEAVSTDEGKRDERGNLPRSYVVASFQSAAPGAPEFVWFDYRGAWGIDVEVVVKGNGAAEGGKTSKQASRC